MKFRLPSMPIQFPNCREEVVDVETEEQDNNRDVKTSPHHHDEIQESSFNDKYT